MADILLGRHARAQIRIYHDEDWNDPLPVLQEGGVPKNLDPAVARLELWIRPVYDHSVVIRKLSSDPINGANGITISTDAGSPPTTWQATLYLPRAVVNTLPLGTFEQFMILIDRHEDPALDGIRELWRGPILIAPGRTTP